MKISFILATVFLLSTVGVAVASKKKKNKVSDFLGWTKIMIFGVFVAAFVLYIPVWYNFFAEKGLEMWHYAATVVLSLHNALRMFMLDADFLMVDTYVKGDGFFYQAYYVLLALVYVSAPLLTFGFVLSFFKNASAHLRLLFFHNADIYVFSELNTKSLALAESISEKAQSDGKKHIVVFTDVFEGSEENKYEFIHKANELGAICFKKDIVNIDFSKRRTNASLYFFVIGDDPNENIIQALKIAEFYKYEKNTHMYVFATQIESEIIMTNVFDEKKKSDKEVRMKIRRLDEAYSIIIKNLYENGYEKIFSGAVEDENGIKNINVLVVGMGRHGTEMIKALSWFCQMDGYRLRLDSVDEDEKAEEKFALLCPELMSEKYNGHYDIEGEPGYDIRIHSGVNIESSGFYDIVEKLGRTTYVFVALGDDEKNVNTAIRLRALFARKGYKPEIQAIVYNSEKKEALKGVRNFKGQEYNIDFIGDIGTSFSENAILGSDLETKAKERHLKFGDEKSFWQYDYNRRSSFASVIHRRMKILCKIPGAEKNPEERSEEELLIIRTLEHKRWNAYMRSEGYMYGPERNDIAKIHNLLVPYDKLDIANQIKDDD